MAVDAVVEQSVEPYAGGQAFGPAGPYRARRLTVTHAVDPAHPTNAAIVDLEHAAPDGRGLVVFDQDVLILEPEEGVGNARALVDVVNRGRPTAFRFLNQDRTAAFPPPLLPEVGDGHLLAGGWTVVAAGWQFDVDHPSLLGLAAPEARPGGEVLRGSVTYAAQPPVDTERVRLALPGHRPPAAVDGPASLLASGADGLELHPVDDDRWSFSEDGRYALLDGGFRAGHRYQWTYTTAHSAVAGCGLLALRDLAPWLRSGFGSGSGSGSASGSEGGGAERQVGTTILFGVSQCGRVIRQFLADGLNVGEDGVRAYDGVMPLIAGGRLGQFNQRFANPGILPMGDEGLGGPARYDELLAQQEAGHRPRVMALNTSTEYWRGDAALVHPNGEGGAETDGVRVHLVASTQHTPGVVPQEFEDPYLGTKGNRGFSTVDYGPVNRALLDQLVAWVEEDVDPTPSTVPAPSTGPGPGHDALSDRATVLSRFEARGWPVPDEASFGHPAGPVPGIDDDGNEVAGIRLPDVTVPLGTHTGWNTRHPDCGAPSYQLMLRGTTHWLPTAELEGRYQGRDEYLRAVGHAVDKLIDQRLILATDRQLLLDQAAARWDAATNPNHPPT